MKTFLQRLANSAGFEIRRKHDLPAKTFAPFVRAIELGSHKFSMWITNPDTEAWFVSYSEKDIKAEQREWLRLAKPGDRLLEIGSHQGYYSLLLANALGPDGFVLGVEANPENVMALQANITLNGQGPKIKALHRAGAAEDDLVLNISEHHNASIQPMQNAVAGAVQSVTGDWLDAEYGPFTMLKIDVEGFEAEVLKGCPKLLARCPVIGLELHVDLLSRYGATVNEILDLIDLSRYRVTMIVRPDWQTVQEFDRQKLEGVSIANLFFEPLSH